VEQFITNLQRWLTYSCYLAFIGVGFDLLQYLPVHIAERIIEAFLNKLGL
jgi:hypothetical protein